MAKKKKKKGKWNRIESHAVNPDAAAAAKSLQSCLTLYDPIDRSPPGSPVPGILQARTLEWVAISFSNAWKWKVKVKSLSRVQLLATPWTAAYQAPPSMGFSRQECWSGVPLPSPVNPHICGQLTFDKGVKIIQWGKNSLFNNCMSTCKRNMKVDLSYHTIHRIYRNELRVDQRHKCKC